MLDLRNRISIYQPEQEGLIFPEIPEFINVDELIQAQINEGCHGLDAFTSSSRGPLFGHAASLKSPTINYQSASSLATGPHHTLLKESLLGK